MSTVKLEICSGVEGPSAYVNDYRCAGPKPWGGGTILHKFNLRLDDLAVAVARAGRYDPEQIINKLTEYGQAREKVGKSRDDKGQAHDMEAIDVVVRLEREMKELLALPAIEQRLHSKRKQKPQPA